MIGQVVRAGIVWSVLFAVGCASQGPGRGTRAAQHQSAPPADVRVDPPDAKPITSSASESDSSSTSKAEVAYELRMVGEDWPNGEPMYREEIKLFPDGTQVKHGTRTTYWENGQEKLRMHFVDGVAHGPKATWHLDGTEWAVGGFVNGKEDGRWTTWYPTGTKQQEFFMEDGALHGVQSSWYFDGRKRSQGRWVHGKQVGFHTVWDTDSNIVQEIDYGPGGP